MIEDILKYRMLLEHTVLHEDYQSRVQELAQKILQQFQNQPVDRTELESAIKREINWPLGSVSPQEVVKDVAAALRGQLQVARQSRQPQSAKKTLARLAEYAAHALTDELGNTFPDGDPHDATVNVFQKIINNRNQLSRLLGADAQNISLDDVVKATNNQGFRLQDWFWNVLYPGVVTAFKKHNGHEPWHYLAILWDENYPGQPNPYKS